METTTLFITAWDSTNYSTAKVLINPLSWFTTDNGYTEDSISKVKNLSTGEAVEIEKGHTVIGLN